MSRSSCTTIRECCPPIHEGRPARPPASADTAAHAAAPIRRCDYVALVSCPSSGAAVSQARRGRSACLPRLAWGVVADRELLEATLSSYHRVRVQHIGLHPLYPFVNSCTLCSELRMQRTSRSARRALRKSRTLRCQHAVTECPESFDTCSTVRLPNAGVHVLYTPSARQPNKNPHRALLFVCKLVLSYTHLVHRESL